LEEFTNDFARQETFQFPENVARSLSCGIPQQNWSSILSADDRWAVSATLCITEINTPFYFPRGAITARLAASSLPGPSPSGYILWTSIITAKSTP